MSKTRTAILLTIALSGALQGVSVSLDTAPSYALRHNRQIAVARLRLQEASGRLLGAGRLNNPELEVEASHNLRRAERTFGVGFTQRFPLTARLTLERGISAIQFAAAKAEVRDEERQLAADTRLAATKFVALAAQRRLREEQLTNSREQRDFLSKRLDVGEAATVDVLQLDLEGQQLEADLLQIDAARATLVGELLSLLGVEPDETLVITGSLGPPDSPPARGARVDGRPDVEASRHHLDAANQEIELAKARKWEDVGVGLITSFERMEDAPEGLSNDYFLGLKLSVPLPFWNKNEGSIAEATATAERARQASAALAFSVRSDAEAARREMIALAKVIAETDAKLLPQAAKIEEQLRTSYSTGQAPLTEVLRARARKLELAQRRLDSLRDYHLARARYDAALGRNLPPTQNPSK